MPAGFEPLRPLAARPPPAGSAGGGKAARAAACACACAGGGGDGAVALADVREGSQLCAASTRGGWHGARTGLLRAPRASGPDVLHDRVRQEWPWVASAAPGRSPRAADPASRRARVPPAKVAVPSLCAASSPRGSRACLAPRVPPCGPWTRLLPGPLCAREHRVPWCPSAACQLVLGRRPHGVPVG